MVSVYVHGRRATTGMTRVMTSRWIRDCSVALTAYH